MAEMWRCGGETSGGVAVWRCGEAVEWRSGGVARMWRSGEVASGGNLAEWRSGGNVAVWRTGDVTEWWWRQRSKSDQRQFRMQLRFRENSSLVIMRFDRRC